MSSKPMDAAIALAALSKCRHKHGAVLVKKGQVIASGVNLRLRAPTDAAWRISSLHAEEHVLAIAGTAAQGATLYIARVNAKGEPKLSLPCGKCRNKILRARVGRVVTT